jgi:hypothetical protein
MNTYETAFRKIVAENSFLWQEFCRDTRSSGAGLINAALSYHTPEKAFRLTIEHFNLFKSTTAHLYKAGWSVPPVEKQPPVGEYYRETPERLSDIDAEVKKHIGLKPIEGESIPDKHEVTHIPIDAAKAVGGGFFLILGAAAVALYLLLGRKRS